eukprot:TRINITY_DN5641_c0_g1_i1.p1 TRINITY_DN5641_c0_g1~~TRINITY_DN5641_c0_g1_i1.p1  ORF type:complete len:193 (-),score=33.72 TRINITY_DN5641_c0_g1_i1:100-678(-)
MEGGAFAEGLYNLLQPIVTECDQRMLAVFKSQSELSDQIDNLSRDLESFVQVSQNPSPALIAPVQTLMRSKQRLNSINNTLVSIKERLDRMEKLANPDNNAGKLPDVLSNIFGKIRSPAVPVKAMPEGPVVATPTETRVIAPSVAPTPDVTTANATPSDVSAPASSTPASNVSAPTNAPDTKDLNNDQEASN